MQDVKPFASQMDKKNKDEGDETSAASNQQSAPQQTSGASVSLTGGLTGSSAPISTPKESTSGRYQNLQKYMNAGKNWVNAQGQRGLASSIATNIGNAGTQAGTDIQALQDAFNQQSGRNIEDLRAAGTAASGIIGGIVPPAAPQPTATQQPTTPPTTITPEQLGTFAKARDAEYTGPQDLSQVTGDITLGKVQGQVNDVGSKTGQAQTERGRYNLLRSMFNNGHYSRGQQDLDNLLIQNDKEQMKQLNALRGQSSQLAGKLGAANQESKDNSAAYSKEANDIRNTTRDNLSKAVGGIGEEITKRYDDAVKEADAMRNWINGTGLAPESVASASDIKADNGMVSKNYFGVNKDLVKVNDPASMASVANKDEAAKLMALRELIGGVDLGGDAQKYLSNLGDLSDAGTFTTPYTGAGDFVKQVNDAAIKANSDLAKASDALNNAAQPQYASSGNSAFSYGVNKWDNNWTPEQKISELLRTRDTFIPNSPQWNFYNNAVDSYNKVKAQYGLMRLMEGTSPDSGKLPSGGGIKPRGPII